MINRSPNMAFCLRSFPNKLTNLRPMVLKRRHVTSPDRHPCRRNFLQEFLGTRTCVSPASHPVIPWSCEGLTQSSTTDLSGNVLAYALITIKRAGACDDHLQFRAYLRSSRNRVPSHQPDGQTRNYRESKSFDSDADPSVQVGVRTYTGTLDDICLNDSLISHPALWNVDSGVVSTDVEKHMLLLAKVSPFKVNTDVVKGDPSQPPTEDQLEHVRNILAEDLNMFFVKPLTYVIYHPDIVFENNFLGKTFVGIYPYVKQVLYLRFVGHAKFMYVKFEVMKITSHPEDGTVRVRWRINGIRATKIFKFWTFKLWDWSSMWKQQEVWLDGFSTFYVRGDGLVHKHTASRMMPDEEQLVSKKDKKVVEAPADTVYFLPQSSLYVKNAEDGACQYVFPHNALEE